MLNRMQTTKFPLCCLVMEMAEQMKARQLRLQVNWAPREVNAEADALTNQWFTGFDESKRIQVNLEAIQWKILPAMLEAGKDYYTELRGAREAAKRERRPQLKRKAADSLRTRDPW